MITSQGVAKNEDPKILNLQSVFSSRARKSCSIILSKRLRE